MQYTVSVENRSEMFRKGQFFWSHTHTAFNLNWYTYYRKTFNCFAKQTNFRRKIYKLLSYWLEYIVMPSLETPGQQKLLEQMFLNALNMPTIDDLKRNASLLNIRFAVGIARLHKIWLKLVACIYHCCQKMYRNYFMNQKKNGAIYFAFKSVIKYL